MSKTLDYLVVLSRELVGPLLWSILEYLDHYWMDSHDVLQRH